MIYKINYTPGACKQLAKLDKQTAQRVVKYMKSKADNPTSSGKPLKNKLKGYWRHRVGDYRVLSVTKEDVLIVLVVFVGHRKNIYLKNQN